MSSRLPNYVTHAQWDCIEKIRSREIAIIDLYRHVFGEQSIPGDCQYWSMCGAHFNGVGNERRQLKGELGHLCESKLIHHKQYIGVDKEKLIIDENRNMLPDMNWIKGDFLDTMERAIYEHKFNPAIINYDGVMQPKYGTQYLKKILKMVDYNVSRELMLVANFVLLNPYSDPKKVYQFSIMDTIESLASIYWIPDHWDVFPRAYQYTSPSRNGNSVMGIIVFVKHEHNPKKIKWTDNRITGG